MAARQPSSRVTNEAAWLVTGPLALLAVLCATALLLTTESAVGAWPTTILFFVLTALATIPMFTIVVRRQTLILTLAELPLVLALFYLPPLSVVIAHTAATLLMQLRLRAAPAKIWFNVAKAAAAASIAVSVVAALPPIRGVGPGTWGILFAGVSTHVLTTLAAVVTVVTVVQGWPAGRELLQSSLPTLMAGAISVAIGLLILIAFNTTPWSVILFTAVLVVLFPVYQTYSQFFRQHRTLADMYELTRAMTESGQDGTLVDALLGRVRTLMQAEYATLWLPAQGRHPEVLLTAQEGQRGLLDTTAAPPEIREATMQEKRTIALGSRLDDDPALRGLLRARGIKDIIVVPLRSGQATIGTLEVTNRLGDTNQFTTSDVPIFQTVAAHAAVAVENSRLVDRLRHDAYHDTLTKLPNRRRVTQALREAVGIRAPGEVVAVLLFDVDGLRQVNESLGHAAGDKVLAEVASRLRRSAPSSALVGRVGGDEFAVTLRLETADEAEQLAAELREQIRAEMVFGNLTLDVDTAVGVAVHPEHGADPETLLQRVDLAAAAAKSAPGSIQFFHPALESGSTRRLGLAPDLRQALDDNAIEVHFQPKVTLGTRRLVGVECLARWEHPAEGPVAPEDFVAVAEHTGQLGRLTELVLREGLRRSRDWSHDDGPLAIAVNISARTLTDQHFPARVQELLTEYGVPAERVTFEIKEAGLLDGTDRPIPTLLRLRDLGVRLSVDDFGTGNSSLAYLRRLPVHEVKVDNSFVQGMATDPGDLAIVNAIVTLSQQFGLTVVAEGVESELTLELLQDIGCEIAQGFLFSRPLPYDRLEGWFAAQTETESPVHAAVRRLRALP